MTDSKRDPKRNSAKGLPRMNGSLMQSLGIQAAAAPQVKTLAQAVKAQRMGYSERQRVRWSMWQKNPHCASCGHLLDWPTGCELDHTIPLEEGGTHDAANLQLLCVYVQEGRKAGCHADKSAKEAAARAAKGFTGVMSDAALSVQPTRKKYRVW